MMSEHLGVVVEVWPVAADNAGIWLISGDDAWRSDRIDSDHEPHDEVEYLLANHGLADSAALLHSTSWRMDEHAVVLTYMSVIKSAGPIPETWADARPVSAALLAVVGQPAPSPVTAPPAPRYIDVLMHGIRHLRFLMDSDSAARDALPDMWRRHLEPITPVLAGMYEHGKRPITL
jgi:hypothetical protein